MNTLHSAVFVVSIALFVCAAMADDAKTEPAGKARDAGIPGAVELSTHGSERATTGPGNNIVTVGDKTHVVWQESDAKGYYDVVRTLDRATGTWADAVRIGPAKDNHARPCIASDSKGFLHVVIGGHGTPMFYYKSKNSNDSSAWEKPVQLGIGTYPMLVCGGDDTLVLGNRHDAGTRGLDLYVKRPGEKWQTREHVFIRHAKYVGYAGYNVALAFGPDGKTLHLAADTFEGFDADKRRGIYQSVIYMVSDDYGATWRKSDGTPIPAKPTPDKLDVISFFDAGDKAKTPPISHRNGGLVVDAKGRPYVYFIHIVDNVRKARLVTPKEGGGWKDLPLDEAFHAKFPKDLPAGARGSLSIDADGGMHVLIQTDPPSAKGPQTHEDAKEDGVNFGLAMLSSRDGGQTFEAREIFPAIAGRKISLASIERPVGHNTIKGRLPSIIWLDGQQRYPKKGEVLDTDVFWMQPK